VRRSVERATKTDLNWRNPDVRDAIYEAMRFWLAKSIFRSSGSSLTTVAISMDSVFRSISAF
jgi:hypothetical protein